MLEINYIMPLYLGRILHCPKSSVLQDSDGDTKLPKGKSKAIPCLFAVLYEK